MPEEGSEGKGLNVLQEAIPKEVYETLEKEMEELADNKRLLSLVGLATRPEGGHEFSTEKSVKSGKSHLHRIEEASDNTKKSLPTCVLTIKSQSICLEQRTNWGMPWAEFRASLRQWRMQVSQSQW